jgi:3-hydroxyisobutyrate dehydrogenase
MRIGFIGLGNVGGQLARNLLRHGSDLTVRDLESKLMDELVSLGARAADNPRQLISEVDVVSPACHRQQPAGKLWKRRTACSQA